MFRDPEYVKWANESTIHVMSYSLDKAAEPDSEPLVEGTRDGEKVQVFAMYPALTPNEAEAVVNEVNAALKFPTSTPWSGVISPLDGKTVLAEMKKGTAKEFRALYEAEQKKLGATLPRDVWKKTVAALAASLEAEFDDKLADAVKLALEAKGLVKDPPKPLAERLETRISALEKAGRSRLDAALQAKDTASRAKALDRVATDFKGLPVAEEAAKAAKDK